MKFGPVPPREAVGATAVHTIRQGALVLKKGTLIGAATRCGRWRRPAFRRSWWRGSSRRRVRGSGRGRDRAGDRGRGRARRPAFTGRCNLFADEAGVLVVDKDAIDALNRVDEAITFATLAAYKPVVAGEMIATVKIIPFAVSEAARKAALAVANKPFIRSRRTGSRRSASSRRCCPGSPPRSSTRRCRSRRSGSRRPARASSPSGACRTNRTRSPRRSTRC